MNLKKFLLTLLIAAALTFSVSAESAQTLFTVKFTDVAKSTVDISVNTDTVSGVGGMDIALYFDNSMWELVKKSAKCGIKKSEVSVTDGSARIIWDTVDNAELPEKLITASFKKRDKTADISDIQLVVNDYYDNTVSLNDIAYRVSYEQTEKVVAVKTVNKSAVIAITVIVIVLLGGSAAYYFLVFRKKGSKH